MWIIFAHYIPSYINTNAFYATVSHYLSKGHLVALLQVTKTPHLQPLPSYINVSCFEHLRWIIFTTVRGRYQIWSDNFSILF